MTDFLRRRMAAALLSIVACATQANAGNANAPAPSCHAATGPLRGALVELYTSEGCSSCPPADRWFATLAASADPSKLSLLAFHVDYWDSLGWPDRFGSGAFSERQRLRVSHAGSSSVYTPQVMFDQRVGFPWGSDAALAALKTANAQPSTLAIDLSAAMAGNGYDVAVKAAPAGGTALPSALLYVALYENGLSTQVKTGENGGVLLHHERVVRQMLGPFPLTGASWARTLHVAGPSDARAPRLGVTAFVQTPRGDTLQALSMPLAACAR
jgi:hypothetical protein